MATRQSQANSDKKTAKPRAACDECRTKKLKCSGERPACARCFREGLTCVYSAQKPMGRPKKRRKTDDQDEVVPRENRAQAPRHANSNLDVSNWHSTFQMLPWSQASNSGWDFSLPTDPTLSILTPESSASSSTHCHLTNNSVPLLDLPPELRNTSARDHRSPRPDTSTNLLHDPDLLGMPTCACLSTLYLTLQTLQTMDPAFPFPSSLHPLREAMTTAAEVLNCDVCPQKFITAMQNTHLIGTLLISIADRFGKALLSITAEAERAEREGETKSLPLSSLSTSTSHLHYDSLGSSLTAFSISLSPAEWRRLAKKVVRVEVYGPGDGKGGSENADQSLCCSHFTALLRHMVTRQGRWHDKDAMLPEDVPRDPVTGLPMAGSSMPKEDHVCLKFAAYASKLVETYDWT